MWQLEHGRGGEAADCIGMETPPVQIGKLQQAQSDTVSQLGHLDDAMPLSGVRVRKKRESTATAEDSSGQLYAL